jgi:hypothetical protein
MFRTIAGTIGVAALVAACAVAIASNVPDTASKPGLTCKAVRSTEDSAGEWDLVVTGPGTVHRLSAEGRTITLPQPYALGRGQELHYDWSGFYAPDPGRCIAS